MNPTRLERIAPLTGVAFLVLLVIGTVLINNYEFLPPGDEIKAFYEDNSTSIRIGAWVVFLGAAALTWFAGSLRVALRKAEGGSGRLSAVSFGGGVAAAATMLVGMGATLTAAARGGSDAGIGVETATGLFDLSAVLIGSVAPIALAVMLGAAAVVSFRTGAFASWFTWVTAVVAIGLLLPELSWIFTAPAALWVALAGYLIYRSEGAAA